MNLERCFAELARRGSVPLAEWPEHQDPAEFGLVVHAGRVVPGVDEFDPLSTASIREALSHRARAWLRRLDLHAVIGSTNAALMERAEAESIDGSVCLAELQLQGRGRRGRGWVSPFGANLAVSLGLALAVPAQRLGGLSLVVGLAVLDALEARGATGLSLKWPNDVMWGDAKLGGILIEVSQRRGLEIVVGVGLNVTIPVSVRNQLPTNVGDLGEAGIRARRSEIAAAVISSAVAFIRAFEESGFEPFRAVFDQRHGLHQRSCEVIQGESRISGTVKGVSKDGELILANPAGDRLFSAGEVSLRPVS